MGDTEARAKRATAGERLDHAIDETRARVGRAVETAKDQVQHVMDEARAGVDSVRGRFDSLKDKKAGDLVDDTKDLVREHPGAALAVSIGAGFLLGWLLRGRD